MKQTLLAGGLDADTAAAMLDTAVAQAKADGTYQSAYSSAYQSAYTSAYNEAYNEAWAKIADEIDEKYADAEEKYDLNDPDFQAVPVTLYENFYRNEDEDHDNDGTPDGTIRVYTQTDDVNLACLIDGAFPVRDDEIAHRPHARRQRRSAHRRHDHRRRQDLPHLRPDRLRQLRHSARKGDGSHVRRAEV